MQQRIKELFPKDLVDTNPFIKEIYKEVRSKGKKLEDIEKIEAKKKTGAKIDEAQLDKLANKDSLLQSVSHTLKVIEVYLDKMPSHHKPLLQEETKAELKVNEASNKETQASVARGKDMGVQLDNEQNVVEMAIS